MNILVTNDDGIMTEGIIRLAEAAKHFGNVWVVAPESQRSANSHRISLEVPLDVYPAKDFPVKDVNAFFCNGSPADCVRVGSLGVMAKKPDLLLSGINSGYNVASDIQYSATCGAAFEGIFQGIHSIAVSEGRDGVHEVTDRYLIEILERLVSEKLPKGHIHNVNFPDCPLKECKGILYNRAVSAGHFYRDEYVKQADLENGGMRYTVKGIYVPESEEGTDYRAILEGYVSVGQVNNIGY